MFWCCVKELVYRKAGWSEFMRVLYVMIDIFILFLYICIQIGEVHWVDVFELFLHSILDILLRIFHLKKKNLSGYILILLRTCQRGSPRCHFWYLLVSRGISDYSTCRGSSIMVLLPFFQRSLRIFFSPYCSKQKHHSITDWCQESNWI